MQNTAPTEPEQTEATSFWKPGRSTNPEPERPRSSSITVTEANPTDRAASTNQLDLDRGDTTMSSAPAPDGLLPALAELLLQALGKQIAPRALAYDHDDPIRRVVNRTDTERTNGHAHCRAMLLGSTVSLPIIDGRLVLGRWQRVLFVELDGPQERTVVATVTGGDR